MPDYLPRLIENAVSHKDWRDRIIMTLWRNTRELSWADRPAFALLDFDTEPWLLLSLPDGSAYSVDSQQTETVRSSELTTGQFIDTGNLTKNVFFTHWTKRQSFDYRAGTTSSWYDRRHPCIARVTPAWTAVFEIVTKRLQWKEQIQFTMWFNIFVIFNLFALYWTTFVKISMTAFQ